MATNPMKRKAKISFILGMLVMLIICGGIIAFLFIQINDYQRKEKENNAAQVNVYTLKQDVSSGQVITSDMYQKIAVHRDTVPSNATSDLTVIDNYALQDKEGNEVISQTKKDSKGNEETKLYLAKGDDEDDYPELKQENGNYYIEKNNGDKEFIELTSTPLIAKVAMKKNTVITKELVAKGENTLADDMRKEEYNSFVLPLDLVTGDYVDVRLMMPSGQNYIVVSKKEVEIPNIDGVDSLETVWLNMSEEEILSISSAIIDAYRIQGSKLYVNKYTEAGMQKAATPTYVASAETLALLQKDPNILQKAKEALAERYSDINASELRNKYINNEIKGEVTEDTLQQQIQQKTQESIQKSQETRQKYLDTLNGTVK